jgi:hypothetical protein
LEYNKNGVSIGMELANGLSEKSPFGDFTAMLGEPSSQSESGTFKFYEFSSPPGFLEISTKAQTGEITRLRMTNAPRELD